MIIRLYKENIAWRIELDGIVYDAVQFAELKKVSPATARTRFAKFVNGDIDEQLLLWVGKAPISPAALRAKNTRKDGLKPGNEEWYALGDEDRSHILKDL